MKEPCIKEETGIVVFKSGVFHMPNVHSDFIYPLCEAIRDYSVSELKDNFDSHINEWPEDLEYLLGEYDFKSIDELAIYVSGMELMGNETDNSEPLL